VLDHDATAAEINKRKKIIATYSAIGSAVIQVVALVAGGILGGLTGVAEIGETIADTYAMIEDVTAFIEELATEKVVEDVRTKFNQVQWTPMDGPGFEVENTEDAYICRSLKSTPADKNEIPIWTVRKGDIKLNYPSSSNIQIPPTGIRYFRDQGLVWNVLGEVSDGTFGDVIRASTAPSAPMQYTGNGGALGLFSVQGFRLPTQYITFRSDIEQKYGVTDAQRSVAYDKINAGLDGNGDFTYNLETIIEYPNAWGVDTTGLVSNLTGWNAVILDGHVYAGVIGGVWTEASSQFSVGL
jgi:hypothetical protein